MRYLVMLLSLVMMDLSHGHVRMVVDARPWHRRGPWLLLRNRCSLKYKGNKNCYLTLR